jgi:hypothetical protein
MDRVFLSVRILGGSMKLLAALVALVWTFKALEMLGVIG